MTDALIVIDVQKGFEEPLWGPRNNPDCEANVARLIAAWREADQPLVFVRHDAGVEGYALDPGHPGNNLRDVVSGEPALFITKSTNSAFYGSPNLDEWLKRNDIENLTICGIATDWCCDVTARMAGNLGYDVHFVLDATHTFDREDAEGVIPAALVARVTAASLDGEFATVESTTDAVQRIASGDSAHDSDN